MGNRATVIFTDGKTSFSPAVYLHWNGGPESIYGFLNEMDRRNVRPDQDYECAQFINIVGDFFNQDRICGLSLGVTNGPVNCNVEELKKVQTDHGDNGFYLINRTVKPTGMRRFVEHFHDGENGEFTITIEEMSQDDVMTERSVALKDNYISSFRLMFEEITKGKEIEIY